MIKLIKLNPAEDSTSYIYDNANKKKISKLDYNNKDLSIFIDDLCFQIDQVSKQYSGLYYINHEEDKYLLDDGYYDILCRAGYIVLGDQPETHYGKDEGSVILKKIQDDVSESIIELGDKVIEDELFVKNSTNNSIIIEDDNYMYTFIVNPIMDIIMENQKRKLNDLPYYPYIKGIDKYSSVYIRAFAKLISKDYIDEENTSKYTKLDDLIKDLIIILNKKNDYYHLEPVPIKKMITI